MTVRGNDGRGIERAAEANQFASAFYDCLNRMEPVGKACITAILQSDISLWHVRAYVARRISALEDDERRLVVPDHLVEAVQRHSALAVEEMDSAIQKAILELRSSLDKMRFEEFLDGLTSARRMRYFRPWEEQLDPLIYCVKHDSWAAREDYSP